MAAEEGTKEREVAEMDDFALSMPGVLSDILEKVFHHPLCGKLVTILKESLPKEGMYIK